MPRTKDTGRGAGLTGPAAEVGTSVSAVVREFLQAFAGGETAFERRKRLQDETIASIEAFNAADRVGRDEVHERMP